MPLPIEVLTAVKELLSEAESQLKELDEVIAEAHLAGIDVAEERKAAAELKASIRKLRAVYGK